MSIDSEFNACQHKSECVNLLKRIEQLEKTVAMLNNRTLPMTMIGPGLGPSYGPLPKREPEPLDVSIRDVFIREEDAERVLLESLLELPKKDMGVSDD